VTALPTPPIQLMPRDAAYVPFATAQWFHNGQNAAAMTHVPRDVYAHHHHAMMERLWNDPGVTWLFAAHPPDPNYVFGFLVGEATNAGPVVHWLLVRRDMRGFGVARALLAAFLGPVQSTIEPGPAWYTTSTPHWRRCLAEAKSEPFTAHRWQYNPFLQWEPTFRGPA
jgi:GNAT superfamily N-acetyltransferase